MVGRSPFTKGIDIMQNAEQRCHPRALPESPPAERRVFRVSKRDISMTMIAIFHRAIFHAGSTRENMKSPNFRSLTGARSVTAASH
jgi:hypothetical protein